MKFGYLKQLEVKEDKTVEMYLNDIPVDPVPVLVLAPANQMNKSYYNAVLRQSRQMVKGLQQKKKGMIDEETMDRNRKQDRELFPLHVIKGWKDVPDEKGKPAKFTQENCAAFVEQLPDWMFDQIRNYAALPSTFVDEINVGGIARD